MPGGWIKLHRKLMDSPIFANDKLLKVFVWCLMKASHAEHQQLVGKQMIKLDPGQFVFGRHKAAEELELPPATVYSYMLLLEEQQTVVINSSNKYSLVSIVNWAVYQSDDEKLAADEQQMSNKRAADEQQMSTNKNGNKGKNEKNESKDIPFDAIVDYLNSRTGQSYKPSTRKTRTLITARFNEGFTMQDFLRVIDNKTREWMGDPKMVKFLRPETLFGGDHFESYLNQKTVISGKASASTRRPDKPDPRAEAAKKRYEDIYE